MQSLEDEVSRRQEDVENLNRQGDSLRASGGASHVNQTLVQLNHRWHNLRTQFAQYQPAEGAPSQDLVDATSVPSTEVAMETSTAETQVTRETVVTVTTTTTTAVSSQLVFSESPSQFIDCLQRLTTVIEDIAAELRSPVLHGRQYEDFSTQEDKLKVSSCKVAKIPSIIYNYVLMW